MHIGRVATELKSICLLPKEALKLLLDTVDQEKARSYIEEQTPLEWTLEYNRQKPLAEFGLEDVADRIVFFGKMAHWMFFDISPSKPDEAHCLMTIEILFNLRCGSALFVQPYRSILLVHRLQRPDFR